MTIAHHLRELRKRMGRAAIGIVIGIAVGWFAADTVQAALRGPVAEIAATQSRQATINYGNVTSAFDLRMQVAVYAGLVLSSPVWLYQAFAFIVPGLTGREKRYIFGFFFTAVPLFLTGCAAGWLVVPHIVELLTGFGGSGTSAFIDAKQYFDFVVKLVFAVGVAFVLPVFLVLLNAMGVVSGRTLLRSWRIAVLLICVFTAVATPAADVMSMLLLAAPMVLL